MSEMDSYTEENAQQALDYGERQLKRALAEFLNFKDAYNFGSYTSKFETIQEAHGAACGALVAIKELYEWTRPR